MSAFDDEFGLFGDEAEEEQERRSTLGARKIATGETIIDEIEPEDERPARRTRMGPPGDRRGSAPAGDEAGSRWPRRRAMPVKRDPLPDEIAHPRAIELLTFLAKRLVGHPDAVLVELHPDARGAVLELEVHPDDLGKVIGRGGRVAQALRTIVRAGAEGRVTIDIVDSDEDDEDADDASAVSSLSDAPRAADAPPASAVAEPAKKRAAKPRAKKAIAIDAPALDEPVAGDASADEPIAAEPIDAGVEKKVKPRAKAAKASAKTAATKTASAKTPKPRAKKASADAD